MACEYEANGVVAGEVVLARMVRGERGDRAEAVVRASEPRYQRAYDVLVVAYDGESARTLAGLLKGERVRLAVSIRGREWQGRYFVNLRAEHVERVGAEAPVAVAEPEPDDAPMPF